MVTKSNPERGRRGCTARTKSGSLCPAAAVRGSSFCLFHTKGIPSKLGQIGGPRRRQYDLSRLAKFEPPQDAADMRKILAVMVIEMRTGVIDPHLATRIAFVASTFLKAYESEELKNVQSEIDDLKKRILAQETARRHRV